jgi:hypothetical protein
MNELDWSIQLAHKDTAWFNANPSKLLLDGQLVYCSDGANQGKYKIGDGTTQLSALTFYGGVSSSGLTIGTSTITSGTNTRVLYNNNGVVGEYAVTGTGNVVLSDSPTFTNWLTVPRLYGGTGVGDGIDYYSTSGNGTAAAFAHRFLGGNNGGTTLLTILNDGTIRIPNNRVIQGVDSAGTNRSLITWSAGDNITINGRPGTSDILLNPTNGGVGMYIKSSGDGSIGVASPSARWHIVKTTEQLRVGYDTSNYYSTTVGSTGTVTFNAVGSGSKFVFSDNIELTQTVTTESVTSDRTVTIVINGTTYKLLAKA